MESDEESKLLPHQQASNNKIHNQNGFDHQLHHNESSEKMNEKPNSEPQEEEGKSSKNNGANDSAPKDSVAASTVRVCDFCGKEFTSGKALGGHRRHHIQALKKMEAQKNHQPPPTPSNQYALRIKPNNNNNNIGNGNGNGNVNNNNSPSPPPPPPISFRCYVCDKYFPSEKSLYGHMRSHPEREWRGMNPPFTSSSSEEEKEIRDNGVCSSSAGSSSSSLVFVDLSLSCAGSSWLKKDKRGRQSIGAAEAAETLVFISNHGEYLEGRPFPPPSPQEEEEEEVPVKKRRMKRNSDGSPSSSPDLEEELLEDGDDGSLEGENHEWQMTVMSLIKAAKKVKKNMNKKEKVPEKMMVKSKGEDQLVIKTVKQEVVVKSPPTPPQKSVCDICGKSFNCFRALGGHKSKHNKENHKKGKEVVEVGKKREEEVKVCNNEEGEASLICSEERLVISLNSTDEINMSNEGEEEEVMRKASHQSGGPKMRNFDLNVTYGE